MVLNMETNASRLVHALQLIGNECENKTEGQFGRVAEIAVNNAKVKSDEIDFEFTCEGDDDIEANEAEIIIYNLSDNTVKQFAKNKKITITAGYKDDTGIIFSGIIIKVLDKFDTVDRITTIMAIDDIGFQEKSVDSITYAPGTTASYILRDLLSRLPMTVAAFSPVREHIYEDSVTIDGDIISKIQEYAKVCGISTYINKGQIYARSLTVGDNIRFTVSADTGLIGSPEEYETEETVEDKTYTIHGYKISMLLQHRMTTGAIISLNSRNITGKYRVKKWKHTFNESECLTEVETVDT